ncbi:hypothetical protein DQK91_04855 [Oceanidesulfovibrio marinus]|nr:hypothetical protein DQK91_04855 [Oceanidesulfovibrio marinus]
MFQKPAAPLLAGVLCCALLALSAGCPRFQKEDVEKEFNNFVALHQEVNVYTAIVFTMKNNGVIDNSTASYFISKIFATKLHIESILDIIFFYRHSDFGNYDNYIRILEYVNSRLDSLTSTLALQRQTIKDGAPEIDNTAYRRFIEDYTEYLGRIITQVAVLKAKAK